MQTLIDFFASSGFTPHGYCLAWSPVLLWLHILSDAFIVLSYYSIPLTLVYFVRQRKDLPYPWIFLMFGLFIVACGTTHLLSMITIWIPLYWLAGMVKAVTAIISVVSAALMFWVIPQALLLRGPAQLETEVRKKTQSLRLSISKQQQTAEKLRLSEERLKIATESGQIGIWDLDLQTHEMIWNDTMYALYGMQSESISDTYEAWVTRLHPDDRAITEDILKEAVAGLKEYEPEFRIIWPNGEEHYLKGHARVIRDADGKPVRMIGTNWDNQDNALAKQQLHLAHVAINTCKSKFFWLNPNGKITDVNAFACTALGYTREELIGRDVGFFDPDFSDGKWSRFWEALKKEHVIVFESSHQRKDGAFFPVEITTNYVTFNGQEYSFAFSRDITERKAAERALQKNEERLRLALAAANQGLYDLNVQTGETIFSPEYASMLGYDPEEFEETHTQWLERLHPDDYARTAKTFQDYVSGKLLMYHVEFRQKTKSGEWKWILSIGEMVERDAAGKPLRMLGTHNDISERKQMEETLHQTMQLTQIIALAQSRFISLDRNNAFDGLLADILALTDSEYGFIGEVLRTPQGDPYLKTYATTHIAWDGDTRAFYDPNAPQGMEFTKLKSLFGLAMTTEKPVITNDPYHDLHRDGQPEGCPALNSFLCLPIHHGDELVALFGIANRPDGYNQTLVDFLQPLLTNIGQLVIAVRLQEERKRYQAKLQLAASVFSHAREGIMITDVTGNIIEVNDTLTKITGYDRDEILGMNPRILKSDQHSPEFYVSMWQSITEHGHWSGEVWNRHKSGALYAGMLTISAVRDTSGEIQNYVSLFTDITQLKQHQGQLEHMAHYDALTGLPNRVLMADRLQQTMNQCQRRKQSLAVVYLDLDGFKTVNDTYGHETGDEFLIAISHRIKDALREGDTLARIGGDEFVALLVDLEQIGTYEQVLLRLLKAAADPIMVGNNLLRVSASIGVTLYPQDDVDADQLIRHADQAMYIAKQSGKNRYHLFDVDHDTAVQTQHESVERIRRALDSGEFVLHYQPKVNMRSGEVIGVEALIRWQHPERGLVSPAEFLPIIENHIISVELGEWVIDTALIQIGEWHTAGLDIPVSVNIAAKHLQQSNFMARISALLAAHPEIQAHRLELEVLETSALEDITQVTEIMNACRGMGVRFALDDFGTGYSSLTYLKRLPADMLKIDRSFVRDMLEDPDDLTIVNSIIGLANAFRRQVIAEGVETIPHGTRLLALDCELGQGYGIARPMPAADLPSWVTDWSPDASWIG